MMTPVSRDEFTAALVELLVELHGRGGGAAPPELGGLRVDERAARYVAALRHGGEAGGGGFMTARRGRRVTALAAVAPSPFDQKVFGMPVGRVQTLEAVDAAEAAVAVEAVDRRARALGLSLLHARVPSGSRALPALLSSGYQAFGATVTYAGTPLVPAGGGGGGGGVEVAGSARELAEAARLARLGFGDTHLSRDERVDARRGRALYEAWVRAEADRGARVLVIRREGRAVALAVCRDNPLARQLLGVDQWHLHLLAVHPRFRGQGLGREAAGAAFSTALAAGAARVQTGVDTGALAAQRIYARAGLLPVGSSFALHRWLT
jgi:RimJ/RimL family protein N-acetyltransferase